MGRTLPRERVIIILSAPKSVTCVDFVVTSSEHAATSNLGPRVADRKSKNITRIEHRITTAQREERNKHKGGVLWFTGLSGAGKSPLAFRLEEELFKRGYQVYVLDGDNVRDGLNSDLDFSHKGRTENIRRVGEVAALFADAGTICITAFISPYREDRRAARRAA